MTKINTIETTLNAMHEEVQKLINGELDQDGFDRLCEDAKELYEKMIILRYKAYEEKVFGTIAEPVESVSKDEPTIEEKPEEKKEESFFDGIEKVLPIEEKAVVEPKEVISQEEPKDPPAFDFSLFDDDKEEAEAENLSIEEATKINEEKAKTEEELPSLDLEVNEEVIPDATKEEDIVVEKELEKEPEAEVEEKKESSESGMSQSPFTVGLSERPVPSEEKLSSTENWVQEQFFTKFSKIDADEVQQLAISKLSTLLGAFGLNERLQCINELFDGSSEAFSEAIKVLDNAGTLDAAIKVASEFALKYEWDLNSETVDEFVFKIKRRYA